MPITEDLPIPNPSDVPDDAAMMRQVPRFNSRSLFGQANTVQIEHEGKIYELRLTRLGKLILTA